MELLDYGFEFLKTLSQKIGDLSGFVPMSRELVQNADDEECEWISFDLTKDALIVKNPSRFKDEDFDKIRTIGSEGKIEDSEKTGRFGVGFVSVFQICDHPEIRSNGISLTLFPEQQKAGKEDIPITNGTEFILSWAKDNSVVRENLKRPTISKEDILEFSSELVRSLPETFLFLRHVRRIEVVTPTGELFVGIRSLDENHIRRVEIFKDGPQGELLQQTRWFVLEEVNHTRVEVSQVARTSSIGVAFKLDQAKDSGVEAGMLYCTLPTRTPTGLPVSVNGDFSIKSDRMTLVDDGASPDVTWNSDLANRLGSLYSDAVLSARELIPLIDYARLLPPDDYDNPACKMFKGIYDAFIRECVESEIINITITNDVNERWVQAETARLLGAKSNPELFTVMKALGAPLVETDLQGRWNFLSQKLRVKAFSLLDLASLLDDGHSESDVVDSLPTPLQTPQNLEIVYQFIQEEITKKNQLSGTVEVAKTLSLCPCMDNSWRQFGNSIGLPEDLISATPWLCRKRPVVEPTFTNRYPEIVDKLCGKRDIDLVIEELQPIDAKTIKDMANNGDLELFSLYDCLVERRSKLLANEGLKKQISSLAIFQAARSGTFKPLCDLSLPGSFEDPIGLDVLIDVSLLDVTHIGVLEILNVAKLSIIEYLRLLCPQYFLNPYRYGTDDKRYELLSLIKKNVGEIEKFPEILDELKSSRCVLGKDGQYHHPFKCYFADIDLSDIMKDFPRPAEIYGVPLSESWRHFFLEIGVRENPQANDLVQVIRKIAAIPIAESLPIIEKTFYYLANRFPSMDENEQQRLEPLQFIEWLPAEDTDEYQLPTNVYFKTVAKLVGNQGKILRFTRERDIGRDFRKCLGLSHPSIKVVLNNLKDLRQRGEEPDVNIYRELNSNINSLTEAERKILTQEPLLHISNEIGFVIGSHAYWSYQPFGIYRHVLPEKYREFQRLMQEVMLVNNEVRVTDYLDVLLEIADGDQFHSVIKDADYDIIQKIYVVLSTHLDMLSEDVRTETEKEWNSQLTGKRIVLTRQNVLKSSEVCLFADKDWAVKVFSDMINDLLVDKTPSTWGFLNAVGVKPLSSAIHVIDFEEPENRVVSSIGEALGRKSRKKALERIIETYRQSSQRNEWKLFTIENIEIVECDSLEVEFCICINGRKIDSGIQNPNAHYHETTSTLYVLRTLPDEIKLLEVARKLSGILNPSIDPAVLCSPVRYVIDFKIPDDTLHSYLTSMGIDELSDGPVFGESCRSGKESPDESIFDDEAEIDLPADESSENGGTNNDQPQGHTGATGSKEKKVTTPETVVDERLAYFQKKRKEFFEARAAFESANPWTPEMADDQRRPLTSEEKEELLKHATIFYNRQIRNIERHLHELKSGCEVFDIYSSEWDSISLEIRERDGFKCRRCGITGEELKTYDSHLAAHHIVPRKEGGSNWPSNLITLCVSCHREVEGHPELL